jgi:hypothetical protein
MAGVVCSSPIGKWRSSTWGDCQGTVCRNNAWAGGKATKHESAPEFDAADVQNLQTMARVFMTRMVVAHRIASLARFFLRWKAQSEAESKAVLIEVVECASSALQEDHLWSWSQICHGASYHFFSINYSGPDNTRRVATRRFSEFHLLATRLAEQYPRAGLIEMMPPKRYCWLSTPEKEAAFLLRRCYDLTLFLRYLCLHDKIIQHYLFKQFLPEHGNCRGSNEVGSNDVDLLLGRRGGGMMFHDHQASAGSETLTMQRLAATHAQ